MAEAGSSGGWKPEGALDPAVLELMQGKLWQGTCGSGAAKDANREQRGCVMDAIRRMYGSDAVKSPATGKCIRLPGVPRWLNISEALQVISDKKLPIKPVGCCCCDTSHPTSGVDTCVVRPSSAGIIPHGGSMPCQAAIDHACHDGYHCTILVV